MIEVIAPALWLKIAFVWLFLASGVHQQAIAQVDQYYVRLIGNPTTVWAEPMRNSRVLDVIPEESEAILESVDEIDTDGGVFHEVVPLPGSGLTWEVGYVHESELTIGIRRPLQITAGLYGTIATSASESLDLMIGGTTIPSAFGSEGTSPVLGLGVNVGFGRFIPVGGVGVWPRIGFEYALLLTNEDAPEIDSTVFSMVRVELGTDLIYRINSSVDLSLGAVAGIGPLSNEITMTNGQTFTLESFTGGLDLLAGVGLGQAVVRRPNTFRGGIRLKLEGGYRIGFRKAEWSIKRGRTDSDSEETSIDLDGDLEPLNLSGPIFRILVGI